MQTTWDSVRSVLLAGTDWTNPGGGIYVGHGEWSKPGARWDAAQQGDFDAYLRDVSVPQVRELIENYDPAVLWFDTPVGMTRERVELFLPVLCAAGVDHQQSTCQRDHESRIIRTEGASPPALGMGDFDTPEQMIPPNGLVGRDWESCMTINDTWG